MSVTLQAVKNGEHTYSCNCGWIDHAHAAMDTTQPETEHRLDVTEIWKQFPVAGHRGRRSPGGQGWLVKYVPAVGIVSSNLLPHAFPMQWFVRDLGGNADAYRGVALRLYQLGNERNEELQESSDAVKHSAFSYEDLPSNTIAWYRGVFGMNFDQVKRACKAVTKDQSVAVAEAIGVDGIRTKNRDWTKALLFNDKCEPCKKEGLTATGFQPLPEVFRSVAPRDVTFVGGKGDAWPYIVKQGKPTPIIVPVPLPFLAPLPIPLVVPIPIPPGLLPGPLAPDREYPSWDTPPRTLGDVRSPGRGEEPTVRLAGLHGRGRVPGPLADDEA